MTSPFGIAPSEAVRWFREKGYRPSSDWRDTWQEEHARAFSVARATQLDVLADMRDAVDSAIAEGRTLETFRRELRPLLQARGWWGEREVVDPATGEARIEQLGSARRLKTIYETNLRQAQAAGRWERMQRTKAARPYVRYVAVIDGRARDDHAQWHGLILPIDDPFWNTHGPPNGWGCRCKLQQLSEADLRRFGWSVGEAPSVEMKAWRNARTGEVTNVPAGISPGFAYNPGRAPRGFDPRREDVVPLDGNLTAAAMRLPRASELEERRATQRWRDPRASFRARFGNGDSGSVLDPDNEQAMVAEAMLARADAADMPLALEAVSDPDESWLVPSRLPTGAVVMRKVFVRVAPGSSSVVAWRDRAGFVDWQRVPRAELDRWRQGYLTFRRGAR